MNLHKKNPGGSNALPEANDDYPSTRESAGAGTLGSFEGPAIGVSGIEGWFGIM